MTTQHQLSNSHLFTFFLIFNGYHYVTLLKHVNKRDGNTFATGMNEYHIIFSQSAVNSQTDGHFVNLINICLFLPFANRGCRDCG